VHKCNDQSYLHIVNTISIKFVFFIYMRNCHKLLLENHSLAHTPLVQISWNLSCTQSIGIIQQNVCTTSSTLYSKLIVHILDFPF